MQRPQSITSKSVAIAFFALTASLIASSSFALKPYLQVTAGLGFNAIGQTTSFQLDSAVPQTNNRFTANRSNHLAGLVGLGAGVNVITQQNMQLDLGVTAYFIRLATAKGIRTPNFVLKPLSDTLNYQFNDDSYPILAEAKIKFTSIKFQPYLLVGAGVAINRLSDYSETPSDPSKSAVAMPFPFRDNTQTKFAWEVGAGINHNRWNCGYQLMSLNSSNLGSSAAQNTTNRLSTGNIYLSMFTLGMKFSS